MNCLYEKISQHIGHNIVAVSYGSGLNVAIECEDCCVVIVDEDREDLKKAKERTYESHR